MCDIHTTGPGEYLPHTFRPKFWCSQQANEEYVAYINIHVVPTSAESCAWFTDRENQVCASFVKSM